MSMLKKRIRKQGQHHPAWQQAVPAGTPIPPGQPVMITTAPGSVTLESLNPLYAADNGAPFPTRGPGSVPGHMTPYPAGRP